MGDQGEPLPLYSLRRLQDLRGEVPVATHIWCQFCASSCRSIAFQRHESKRLWLLRGAGEAGLVPTSFVILSDVRTLYWELARVLCSRASICCQGLLSDAPWLPLLPAPGILPRCHSREVEAKQAACAPEALLRASPVSSLSQCLGSSALTIKGSRGIL